MWRWEPTSRWCDLPCLWSLEPLPTQHLWWIDWRKFSEQLQDAFLLTSVGWLQLHHSWINNIGWDSLHTRRLVAQNTMFFKIRHNLVNICMPQPPYKMYFQPATFLARQDHQLKCTIPSSTIDAYKFTNSHSNPEESIFGISYSVPTKAVTTITTSAFRDSALPVIRVQHPPPGSKPL